MTEINIKDRVLTACKAISEKKGLDIKIINIEGLSSISDYFVLTTGNNINQVRAISDEVFESLAKEKIHPSHLEGYDKGTWILMDYKDFIVHIFDKDARDFYNLERIWKDAPVEEYND